MPEEISPDELRARLEQKRPIVLLDVRDEWETRLCRPGNSTHIPIEGIEFRTDELKPEEDMGGYCHHGIRSAAVADCLRGRGRAEGGERTVGRAGPRRCS